ncbi:leucine-rich repeat domain-containing protein [uncultured Algibacter sp.]|uniref:leucine-rich repeat domain-containing protein n=1 Tax=uncultured Algibacter sp. TaxID=298659 RepID=UPI00321646A0
MKTNYTKTSIALLFFLFLCYTSNAQYTLTSDDVNFKDGVIISYLNTTEKNIIIPEEINGEPVVAIGRFSFTSNDLLSVVLPKSLKDIGDVAFRGNKLTKIDFPDSVENIYEGAFEDNKLESLTLEGNFNVIGNHAFTGNNIEDLILTASINILGHGSFNNNKIKTINGETSPHGIVYKYENDGVFDTSVIVSYGGNADVIDFIPPFVSKIRSVAFSKCNLTKVVIPSTVNEIQSFAFYRSNITELVIEEGLENIRNNAFWSNNISTISFPNSLKSIEGRAFQHNPIIKINFGNSLVSIGDNAFSGNLILDESKLALPNSIMEIGKNAFSSGILKNIILPEVIKTGFTFIEWKDNLDNTYPANAKVSAEDNNTYKATIVPSFFLEATFVDHDDTLLKTEKLTYGAGAIAPKIPNTKPGYIFDKWDTSFDSVTSDITIKAVYRIALEYTVTFLNIDGSVLTTSTQLESEAVTFPPPIFGEGFVFIRWSGIKFDLTVTPIIAEEVFLRDNERLVYFLDEDGKTVLSFKPFTIGEAAIAPEAPEKKDKTFIGWDTDFSNVTENLVVTAIYESSALSIDDLDKVNNQLSVYPNPINNDQLLTLKFNTSLDVKEIKISNIQGQQIYTNKNIPKELKIAMSYPSGMYILQVITNNNRLITKKISVR